MEIIELLECLGCGKVFDQWSMISHALRCKRNRFAAIAPTTYNKLRWFIYSPKHVLSLILQDIREKIYEKRS